MEINNKLESKLKIDELELNRFPEGVFRQGDIEKVYAFLDCYPAKYYAIRDKKHSGGVFKFKVEREDILKEIQNYQNFSINVSSANYEDNQLLVGEIEISSNNQVYAILSTDKKASVRDAIKYPSYNLSTNIFDNELDRVPYFNIIYEYVIKNKLKDVIVEFSLFDTKVGIYNENIVIYELRTNY